MEQVNDEDSKTKPIYNLKKTIKRHFSINHPSQSQLKSVDDKNYQSTSRNRPDLVDEKAAALRCANICYNIYKHGRPYTDYPDQVALYCKAGVWMGDTNYSCFFSDKFLNSVGQAV